MKVVAFNGSTRKDGNTAIMVRRAFRPLEEAGIETELVQLAGRNIHGCLACYKCIENKDGRCAIKSDLANDCIAKMVEADGIILASPTYFANVTTEMKALIDRAGMVGKANGDQYRRKLGAAVATARRGGAIYTFDSMNHFFLIGQMIVVGSSYWNLGFGMNPGQVEDDTEGLGTMETLGRNMAWLLKKING